MYPFYNRQPTYDNVSPINTPRLYKIMEHKYNIEYPHALPFDEVDTQEKIKATRKLIFDFDYPIWNEDYREQFEINFMNFFYYRQIGSETWGMFRQRLLTQLTIKFPTWNEYYKKQEDLKGRSLFDTVNMLSTTEREIANVGETVGNVADNTNVKGNGSNKAVTSNKNIFQDTPNSALPDDMNFATNITDATSSQESQDESETMSDRIQDSKTTNKGNTTETVTNTQKGSTGNNYSLLLQDFYNVFLNIDLQIFAELNQLFLTVQDW